MALVACLADTATLAAQIAAKTEELGHQVQHLCASSLDRAFRQGLKALAPDLIVLEVTRALDNPHLYFFLRSDSSLRHTPVVLVANGRNLAHQATILEADGFLNAPFDLDALADFLPEHKDMLASAVAA